jgi:feruloyl esterase
MQHCGGGAGPSVFGHLGSGRGDRTRDIDAALEAWVEQRVAPDQIVAAKYQGAPGQGGAVVRTRPLCPYPLVAAYQGTGSTDDAANFICKTR